MRRRRSVFAKGILVARADAIEGALDERDDRSDDRIAAHEWVGRHNAVQIWVLRILAVYDEMHVAH